MAATRSAGEPLEFAFGDIMINLLARRQAKR